MRDKKCVCEECVLARRTLRRAGGVGALIVAATAWLVLSFAGCAWLEKVPIPTPPTPRPTASPTAAPDPPPTPSPAPPKDCSVVLCGPDTVCVDLDTGPVCVPIPPPPPSPDPEPTAPPSEPPPGPTDPACFPPTRPHNAEEDPTCPWGACLTECPPVANYGIYFERVQRRGVGEVCRGHLGNPQNKVPGCFQYVEKDGKAQPGDIISFGMTPRGSNAQRDPVTGKDSCCWYGDGRRDCELPTGCPAPPGEFKPIGYTGSPCKLNDSFSITCFPANTGWKMLACPPAGMIDPTTGKPFMGTKGCNQRLVK